MKKHAGALGICAFVILAAACASEERVTPPAPDAGTIGLAPPTAGDGGDGAAEPNAVPACIGTECPAGFATCLSGPASSASHKCGVNLSNDNANCGECGNECLVYLPLHMASRCVEGACELQCFSTAAVLNPREWRNCNEIIDDGCEIDILSDPKHCGACGTACPAGIPCLGGRCGCDIGETLCNGKCVDTATDPANCGECGIDCSTIPIQDECKPPPPGTHYGCSAGHCGQLLCNRGRADCNDDVSTLRCASDGCEVKNLRTDPNNCGECHVKCKPNEECITEYGDTHCGIRCAQYGGSPCGDICVDLLNDVESCGACGHACSTEGPHQIRTCRKGVCTYECEEGFADCNEQPADGCEVDLRAHPEHCGACGARCDVELGQPCVDGVCLTVDCTEPGAR